MPRHRIAFFRQAISAFGLMMLTASGLAGCKKEKPPEPKNTAYAEPARYTMPEVQQDQPPILFTDVTEAAGIDFRHHTGAFGKKWMPETMGSGGGFLDYDLDGDDDIFLVNGCDWPGQERSGVRPTMALYRNRGDGTFEDVTAAVGLDITCYGMGCTFGDYDNDGDTDIYVTAVGDNLLLRNDGGRFTDLSRNVDGNSFPSRARKEADRFPPRQPMPPGRGSAPHPSFHTRSKSAGVLGNDPAPGSPPSWSTSATFVDYDRDGRLDLFVANYVKWTPETDLFTTLDGVTKSYATPRQYDGQSCRLYRNIDGTRFEDVTKAAGVFNDDGKSLGVIVEDFNDDGWPDLFITNDTQPNFLYVNSADPQSPRFEEVALRAGCGYDDVGRARAGMGVDVADFNNDGALTIAIGNFSDEPVSLYAQLKPRLFQDVAGNTRLARPTLKCLTFGVRYADFDLDGFVDLILANGHIEPEINKVRNEVTFAQPPQLFRNSQSGRFVDVTADAGGALGRPIVGRGIATADIDDDGDLDVLFTVNGGPAKLFRNDTIHGNNWIKLKLVRAETKAAAYGARIVATAGDLVQRRMLRAASGYLTQSSSAIVLGLGNQTQLDRLAIRWPGGQSQAVYSLAGNTTHVIPKPLDAH